MGADTVGIADDDGGRDRLPLLGDDSPHLPLLDDDPADGGAGADIDAEIDREGGQGPRYGAGAPPRIPDAVAGLHVCDATEDRRR